MCLDALIQKMLFEIKNIHNFRCGLMDMSSKEEALTANCSLFLLTLNAATKNSVAVEMKQVVLLF